MSGGAELVIFAPLAVGAAAATGAVFALGGAVAGVGFAASVTEDAAVEAARMAASVASGAANHIRTVRSNAETLRAQRAASGSVRRLELATSAGQEGAIAREASQAAAIRVRPGSYTTSIIGRRIAILRGMAGSISAVPPELQKRLDDLESDLEAVSDSVALLDDIEQALEVAAKMRTARPEAASTPEAESHAHMVAEIRRKTQYVADAMSNPVYDSVPAADFRADVLKRLEAIQDRPASESVLASARELGVRAGKDLRQRISREIGLDRAWTEANLVISELEADPLLAASVLDLRESLDALPADTDAAEVRNLTAMALRRSEQLGTALEAISALKASQAEVMAAFQQMGYGVTALAGDDWQGSVVVRVSEQHGIELSFSACESGVQVRTEMVAYDETYAFVDDASQEGVCAVLDKLVEALGGEVSGEKRLQLETGHRLRVVRGESTSSQEAGHVRKSPSVRHMKG